MINSWRLAGPSPAHTLFLVLAFYVAAGLICQISCHSSNAVEMAVNRNAGVTLHSIMGKVSSASLKVESLAVQREHLASRPAIRQLVLLAGNTKSMREVLFAVAAKIF
ncbi:hypothetical protein V6N12_040689 [Hibiscus sabdariffa]|uniref:Uncharacterized protein n=1 Tax=Hibiscus sabdariffa TaxID=183260 RepID=A0ABR2E4C9_9ROSI